MFLLCYCTSKNFQLVKFLKNLLFPTYLIFKESKSCKEEYKMTRTVPSRSLKPDAHPLGLRYCSQYTEHITT